MFWLLLAVGCIDVVYINMEGRPDRRLNIEAQLRSARACGLAVTRFNAFSVSNGHLHKHNRGGAGCALSHAAAVGSFVGTGNPLLVLEDDVVWEAEPTCDFFRELCAVRTPTHVLMLAQHMGTLHSCNGTRCDVTGAETASAYVVADHYKTALMHSFAHATVKLAMGEAYEKWAIDQNWKRLQLRGGWAAYHPSVMKQGASYSSIEQRNVDYNY